MKKIKPFLTLLILGLTLTGCNDNTSSSSSSSSSSSTKSIASALETIKTNYQFESTIKLTSGSSVEKYICDVSLADNLYKVTNYEAVDSAGQTATTDSIDNITYYSKGSKNDFAYNVYLGLDNQIHYVALTSSSTGKPIKWESSNYTNPFEDLTEDDFSQVTAGFKLKTTTATQKAALSKIGVNLSGGLPIEAKSVLVSEENDTISVTINYTDATTSSGYSVGVTLQGTFTKFGSDLASLPTTVNKKDDFFDNAISQLKSANFQFDSTRTGLISLEYENTEYIYQQQRYTYSGKSDGIDFVMDSYYQTFDTTSGEYGDRLAQSSTGIKQVKEGNSTGVVQVTQVNDKSENTNYYYYDGAIQEGYTLKDNFLPSYELSSAFFTKDSTKSTDTVAVYTFDTDTYVEVVNSKNYSPIELSMDLDGFTVTIDTTDSSNTVISFTNVYETTTVVQINSSYYQLPLVVTDVVTYSNIGKISEGVFSQDIKTDCSNLVWSDTWENSCGYVLEDGTIASINDIYGIDADTLDSNLPMLGGVYPSYEVNAYNSQYWLTYSTTSQSELSNMFISYRAILLENGFTASEVSEDTNSLVYTKSITVGSTTKTLQVEITVLQGSSTYYLAICPSIVTAAE